MIEDILTGREMQVAALIAEGFEYAAIASMLGKKRETVRNQAGTIYRKLGLNIDPQRRPSILLTRLVMREQMD